MREMDKSFVWLLLLLLYKGSDGIPQSDLSLPSTGAVNILTTLTSDFTKNKPQPIGINGGAAISTHMDIAKPSDGFHVVDVLNSFPTTNTVNTNTVNTLGNEVTLSNTEIQLHSSKPSNTGSVNVLGVPGSAPVSANTLTGNTEFVLTEPEFTIGTLPALPTQQAFDLPLENGESMNSLPPLPVFSSGVSSSDQQLIANFQTPPPEFGTFSSTNTKEPKVDSLSKISSDFGMSQLDLTGFNTGSVSSIDPNFFKTGNTAADLSSTFLSANPTFPSPFKTTKGISSAEHTTSKPELVTSKANTMDLLHSRSELLPDHALDLPAPGDSPLPAQSVDLNQQNSGLLPDHALDLPPTKSGSMNMLATRGSDVDLSRLQDIGPLPDHAMDLPPTKTGTMNSSPIRGSDGDLSQLQDIGPLPDHAMDLPPTNSGTMELPTSNSVAVNLSPIPESKPLTDHVLDLSPSNSGTMDLSAPSRSVVDLSPLPKNEPLPDHAMDLPPTNSGSTDLSATSSNSMASSPLKDSGTLPDLAMNLQPPSSGVNYLSPSPIRESLPDNTMNLPPKDSVAKSPPNIGQLPDHAMDLPPISGTAGLSPQNGGPFLNDLSLTGNDVTAVDLQLHKTEILPDHAINLLPQTNEAYQDQALGIPPSSSDPTQNSRVDLSAPPSNRASNLQQPSSEGIPNNVNLSPTRDVMSPDQIKDVTPPATGILQDVSLSSNAINAASELLQPGSVLLLDPQPESGIESPRSLPMELVQNSAITLTSSNTGKPTDQLFKPDTSLASPNDRLSEGQTMDQTATNNTSVSGTSVDTVSVNTGTTTDQPTTDLQINVGLGQPGPQKDPVTEILQPTNDPSSTISKEGTGLPISEVPANQEKELTANTPLPKFNSNQVIPSNDPSIGINTAPSSSISSPVLAGNGEATVNTLSSSSPNGQFSDSSVNVVSPPQTNKENAPTQLTQDTYQTTINPGLLKNTPSNSEVFSDTGVNAGEPTLPILDQLPPNTSTKPSTNLDPQARTQSTDVYERTQHQAGTDSKHNKELNIQIGLSNTVSNAANTNTKPNLANTEGNGLPSPTLGDSNSNTQILDAKGLQGLTTQPSQEVGMITDNKSFDVFNNPSSVDNIFMRTNSIQEVPSKITIASNPAQISSDSNQPGALNTESTISRNSNPSLLIPSIIPSTQGFTSQSNKGALKFNLTGSLIDQFGPKSSQPTNTVRTTPQQPANQDSVSSGIGSSYTNPDIAQSVGPNKQNNPLTIPSVNNSGISTVQLFPSDLSVNKADQFSSNPSTISNLASSKQNQNDLADPNIPRSSKTKSAVQQVDTPFSGTFQSTNSQPKTRLSDFNQEQTNTNIFRNEVPTSTTQVNWQQQILQGIQGTGTQSPTQIQFTPDASQLLQQLQSLPPGSMPNQANLKEIQDALKNLQPKNQAVPQSNQQPSQPQQQQQNSHLQHQEQQQHQIQQTQQLQQNTQQIQQQQQRTQNQQVNMEKIQQQQQRTQIQQQQQPLINPSQSLQQQLQQQQYMRQQQIQEQQQLLRLQQQRKQQSLQQPQQQPQQPNSHLTQLQQGYPSKYQQYKNSLLKQNHPRTSVPNSQYRQYQLGHQQTFKSQYPPGSKNSEWASYVQKNPGTISLRPVTTNNRPQPTGQVTQNSHYQQIRQIQPRQDQQTIQLNQAQKTVQPPQTRRLPKPPQARQTVIQRPSGSTIARPNIALPSQQNELISRVSEIPNSAVSSASIKSQSLLQGNIPRALPEGAATYRSGGGRGVGNDMWLTMMMMNQMGGGEGMPMSKIMEMMNPKPTPPPKPTTPPPKTLKDALGYYDPVMKEFIPRGAGYGPEIVKPTKPTPVTQNPQMMNPQMMSQMMAYMTRLRVQNPQMAGVLAQNPQMLQRMAQFQALNSVQRTHGTHPLVQQQYSPQNTITSQKSSHPLMAQELRQSPSITHTKQISPAGSISVQNSIDYVGKSRLKAFEHIKRLPRQSLFDEYSEWRLETGVMNTQKNLKQFLKFLKDKINKIAHLFLPRQMALA